MGCGGGDGERKGEWGDEEKGKMREEMRRGREEEGGDEFVSGQCRLPKG